MRQRKPQDRRRGFKLAAIVVLAIIVLVGIGRLFVPPSFGMRPTRKMSLAESQVDALRDAVDRYLLENDRMPESLETLLEKDDRNQPHLVDEALLLDPWNNKIEILKYSFGWLVTSAGPDGDMSTEDDITSRR